MKSESEERSGARFFDEKSRDRGWAGKVTRRVQQVTGLTILDVTTPEPSLASFLTALDKARLSVQHTGTSAESYTFVWASGYANGTDIRVQGVLERP